MLDGSRPNDLFELKSEHLRVSERIARLDEAIAELEGAAKLRADAAARLLKYRENHARLGFEQRRLEWEMQDFRTLSDEMLERARNKTNTQPETR
jgi:hypothetical protein